MTRKPQLLFLAYYFPPVQAIASVRSWSMVKYLSRLGWQIQVVTPHPSLWSTVDRSGMQQVEELEDVRCLYTGHSWRCLNPGYVKCRNQGFGWLAGGLCRRAARWQEIEREAGWASAVTEVCSGLSPGDVDLVLATGGPFIAFDLASRLGKMLRRPYVVDYRDSWTRNPHISKSPRTATIQREAMLVKDCAAATTVSASVGSSIDSRFDVGDRLHIVPNGYDPEELASVEPVSFDHFAIVYTGQLGPPKRSIEPVMAALRELKDSSEKSPPWGFHYYGHHSDYVRATAEKYGVSDRVHLHGVVSRSAAMGAVKGAGAAVVITSVLETSSVEDRGIVTGKVFEAMGLGTPILAIAPAESDIEKVIRTGPVARRCSGSDVPGMVSFLRETMTQDRRSCGIDSASYAWPTIARKMDNVLRTAMNAPSN